MLKITMSIALALSTTMLQAKSLYDLHRETFGDPCNAPYTSLLENQQQMKNYKNLSKRSQEQLTYSLKYNVEQCLVYCKGDKFTYCDNVQKKIESSEKKTSSWF